MEPSLEREGAEGGLRSALPLATEGTQEVFLMKEGWMVGRSYEGCWGENRALEVSMRSNLILPWRSELLDHGLHLLWAIVIIENREPQAQELLVKLPVLLDPS